MNLWHHNDVLGYKPTPSKARSILLLLLRFAMARTQLSPPISGFPRDKRFNHSFLKEEVRKKTKILRIIAPLGIIGVPGSGRKTLAYRFANMNHGVIQEGEVPVAYFYMKSLTGRFSPKAPDNPYDGYFLSLKFYIIEQPEELPFHIPPLYWEHMDNFCCLVFAFDVRNQRSFLDATLSLAMDRRVNENQFRYLLVGNKSDRRHEPPVNLNDPEYMNQRPVPERDAYMEAEHLGAFYFENSAKYNTEVLPLFSFIKLCALDRRYWIDEE